MKKAALFGAAIDLGTGFAPIYMELAGHSWTLTNQVHVEFPNGLLHERISEHSSCAIYSIDFKISLILAAWFELIIKCPTTMAN